MNQVELAADINLYDYKKHEVYHDKILVVCDKTTGKIFNVGKDCEAYLGRLPESMVMVSPMELGKIDDYMPTYQTVKYLMYKYFGRPHIVGKYRKGLIFVHEDCNDIEKRAFEDLVFQCGFTDITYMDERVEGVPQGTSWEEVIWSMENFGKKKLSYAIEFTKVDYSCYVRRTVEKLIENCNRKGIDKEMLKQLIDEC